MRMISQKKLPKNNTKNESQIERLPDIKEKIIKNMSKKEREDVEGLIDAIEAIGLEEFIEYIRSPWKMLWPNFVAGVARGFGALVGATIVIALVGWTLSILIDLPLIGQQLEPYVHQIQTEFKKYTEATNYKKNFEEISTTLVEIREELKQERENPLLTRPQP